MDIEALIKKYADRYRWSATGTTVKAMRAALTELAAGYEKKIAGLESEAILSRALSERIRQLEVELSESREQAERMLDAIDKLWPLASRTLWMAFVWNDHNFKHPLDYAREEAKKAGLNGLEDAQEFLADVAMLAAAPSRCHLCNYQHGHKIGCVNNPVDIALRAAAPAKEGE